MEVVSYIPSNALFVANPNYPNDSSWFFPDLPGASTEVLSITSTLDTTVYTYLTGKRATKNMIMKNICDRDLLYFATYGVSDDNNPLEESFLVLADDDSLGSFLTAKEVQDIRFQCPLKADLVLLSACQTSLGTSHKGGVIGMSRAFQIAGANHVVMSLWSINDESTAILMGFFFEYLKKGNYYMPHEALRSAILKFKYEVRDNPNIWASFSIFGIPY